jgi:hypothetical protein
LFLASSSNAPSQPQLQNLEAKPIENVDQFFESYQLPSKYKRKPIQNDEIDIINVIIEFYCYSLKGSLNFLYFREEVRPKRLNFKGFFCWDSMMLIKILI